MQCNLLAGLWSVTRTKRWLYLASVYSLRSLLFSQLFKYSSNLGIYFPWWVFVILLFLPLCSHLCSTDSLGSVMGRGRALFLLSEVTRSPAQGWALPRSHLPFKCALTAQKVFFWERRRLLSVGKCGEGSYRLYGVFETEQELTKLLFLPFDIM